MIPGEPSMPHIVFILELTPEMVKITQRPLVGLPAAHPQ
jgi:hypothetical protein